MLHRIYDPTRFGASACGYRRAGPYARFDHHWPGMTKRGIFYAASTYEGCIVEVSDDRLLDIGQRRHATLRVLHDLRLLDLRGNGALRAGTDARIGKYPHEQSQPWARYFYESDRYDGPQGLAWLNSHNDGEAFAFFERAGRAFAVEADVRMADELGAVAEITEACGLRIDFSSLP